MTPYLSVVLITKNEEANIGALLDSLTALAPIEYEVCIHDTGSTDRTVEIARERGARVVEGEWTGDYGAARNVALDMARGVWALSVDGDETIEVDGLALDKALRVMAAERPHVYAAYVDLQSVRPGRFSDEWRALRLLRVGRSYWYRAIHEFPAARREGKDVKGSLPASVGLRILNHGLADEVREKQSGKRKLEVMERLIEVERANGTAPHLRALTYFDLARSYAIRVPEKAEVTYWAGHAIPGAGNTHLCICQYLAAYLLESQRWEEARPLIEELEEAGDRLPRLSVYTSWQRALMLRGMGRPDEALDILLTLGDVVDVQGIRVPPHYIARIAAQAAADAGKRDQATVLAATLVGKHRDSAGVAPLLTLWGTRPAELLAKLLIKAAGGENLEGVAELLETDPRGAAVAQILKNS